MADQHALCIYDSIGKVRRDIQPAEISACSKPQQTAVFAVLKSLEAAEKAEAASYEAKKAALRAITALDGARKAYEAAIPKRTFHDEWLETVAKKPPKVITKEANKAIADALIEVGKAEEHLAISQRAEIATRQIERDARGVFAKAAIAWSAIDGISKSVGDLVKQRSATERGIAMANIANGLPVDYAVAQASTVGPSHLDNFKAGQGKGHSANRGYARNSLRGAQLPMAPKVESK